MSKPEFSYKKELMTDETINLINEVANMELPAHHIIKLNASAGYVDINDMVNYAAWIFYSRYHSYIVYVDILNKTILKRQMLESINKDIVNEYAGTELKKLIEEKVFNIGRLYW